MVEKLANELDMTKQRFLCGGFDKRGRDGGVHGHRINEQNEGNNESTV